MATRIDSPAHRAPGPHRHRAAPDGSAPSRLALLWALAAVALTGALGAAALFRPGRAGEGALAANGFLLVHTGTVPGVPALSPDGVAALHLALYAPLTGGFARDDALLSVGRELLLVAALLSACLIWRVASRLGLGHGAAAVAVVLASLPLLFSGTALLDVPAQLAVPWGLAAAWAATADRRILRALLGLPALAVAALLAPPVLVPALAGAAMATFPTGLARRHPVRTALAIGLAAAAGLVLWRLAAGGLGAETALPAADPGVLGPAGLRAAAVAFLLVGMLAAWLLSAFRVPAITLVAGGLAALLPLDRLTILVVCLPLAAVLVAALSGRLSDELTARGQRGGMRGLQVGAAVALVALAGVAGARLTREPARMPAARGPAELLHWIRGELPQGTPVLAPSVVWAELVRAGADEKQLRLPGATAGPQVQIVLGTIPPGTLVLSRVPGSGRPPLLVLDRRRGVPTAGELARRQALAAALLANPTTVAGPRATTVLRAATVDERLLTVLAALGAQFGVSVHDLPPAPGQPPGGLTRYALVDRLGGEPVTPGASTTARLTNWLGAQLPPFRPDSVQVTGDGVLIGFQYVSAPDELVSRAAP